MGTKFTGKDGECCRKCIFFDDMSTRGKGPVSLDFSKQQGECRRYPPTPLVVPVGNGQVGVTNNWTNVLATLWCGEGEAK